MSGHHHRTVCVVLVPPDQAPDPELDRLLAARGWTPHIERDARLAMAELCLLHHEHVMRRAEGEVSEAPSIVIVQPSVWPMVDALTVAITRSLPDALIWHATDGELMCVSQAPRIGGEDAAVPAPRLVRPEPVTEAEISMLLDPDVRP